MEAITANLVGKVRREKLDGRDYLVAPATILVEGVLNGSKGPLYYPPDEIAAKPGVWNKIPIVLNHPTNPDTNEHLSANDRGVLDRQGLGFLSSDSVSGGKRQVETWFDVEKTRRVEPRVLSALESGQPIELSTGLFTEDEMAPQGSHWNGIHYDAIARNYRPDHLAILLDQQGACSRRDGCGVLVNERNIAQRFWDWLTQNAATNQPRCPESGHFQEHNSGTGKGEVHRAAIQGHTQISARDRELGGLAASEKELLGNNPPSWAVDEAKWEKAKTAADKGGYPEDTYWAVVSHIYQQMGGTIQEGTHNAASVRGQDHTGEDDMANREQTIKWLVTNCDCWKGKEKVLGNAEAFTDADIDKLRVNAEKATKATQVVNALSKVTGTDVLTLNADKEMPAFIKKKMKDKEEEEEEEEEEEAENKSLDEADPDEWSAAMAQMRKDGTLQANVLKTIREYKAGVRTKPAANAKPSTLKEWEESMPSEARAVWNSAKEIERHERESLVQRLVAHVQDEGLRKRLTANHLKKPLDVLRDEVAALPTANREQPFTPALPVYAGQQGGPSYGLTENEATDVLDIESARREYDPIFNKRRDPREAV